MKSTKTIRLRSLLLWGILSVFLSGTSAFAQTAKVTGTVLSKRSGEPIVGATITVKKTSRSAVSDMNGKFAINADAGEVLVVSSISFTTQEVNVGSGEIRILLQEADNSLENVIVIGYGTQKKKLVTGATSQVKGEDLAKLNTTNALQALQGQAAGVNITSTSGQPGGGFKVLIRGAGTIGNPNPLYVVDGVLTGDITYLNNSDIASVDILKDAASCAIYGVNGANGVVLITTRNGKSGKKDGQISIDAYYGVQNIARKLPLLNAEQYATIQNEAAINSGKAPLFTQAQIDDLAKGSSILQAHGTDWLHQLFSSNVPIQNINVSANGGSDVSSYSLGGSYTEQGGIIGGANLSDYKRINFKANSERKMYGGALKVGENLTFSMIDQKGVADGGLYSGNVLAGAIGTSPLLAMYDAKGNYLSSLNSTIYNGGSWNNTEANPYALMKYNNQNATKTQRVLGNVYAELEPIKNLRIRSTFGLDYSSSANHSYRPAYDKLSIYAYNLYENISQGGSQGYTWNFDNTINYLFKVKEHSFDVLAGTSIRKAQGTWINGSNTGATLFSSFDRGYLTNSMVTGYTMSADTSAANRQTLTNSISLNGNANAVYALSSFFGRVNYSFKEKYLATAVFRADMSTMFAPGFRQWGYFPSLSAGWVASNEDFMASTHTWLNFLKLRAGWGTNGNDRIDAFNYLSLISLSNARYNFGNDNTTLTQGAFPQTIGVIDTRWESSHQTNIGFDARFLNNKLDVSLDWYNKSTKDWLVQAPLLATTGVPNAPYINGGLVTNKGIELQLAYNGNVGRDFTYTVSGSYAYNKNVVNNIPTADGIIHGGTNSLFVNGPEFFRAAAGNPIGYFWGYKTAGIFQNTADVQAWNGKNGLLQPNAQPGDLKLVDLNGDGVIDAKDKTNIGDPNPHHIFGIRFSANYKNFDLSVTTNGVAGNKIVQSYRSPGQWANYTTDILSRWHGEGTSNKMPRITQNSSNWVEFSDLYIHDGSYLRVSNITLGYDVAKLIKWKYLSQFRLYVAAQNLITFTKYSGMDPEVGASAPDGTGNGATANNPHSFGQGVDNGFYPRPRVYMAGVNINF
ncbi:SusC/RagA family TonB-linked outer membrane protein [Niastella vici]|uniref:SusC/RagA family TonB-linked outer membrane protein n=1 Tax=Niastella vici TaxID=1703345 RepID=A0A1V9FQG3_9BACT|nr:TonB-dependent receptor [Niastella vici]OQP60521.1 SusC/RagA family TonB-linked outer membrane protein [Niastella vici]